MYDFYSGEFPRLESLTQISNPTINSIILVSFAALISTLVVFFIRSSRGSLEFSLLGLKFKGPSGPITLWILTFLALVLALSTFLSAENGVTAPPEFSSNEYYSIQSEIQASDTESEKFEKLRKLFSNNLYQKSISESYNWGNLLYQYTHVRLVIDNSYLGFRSNRNLRISLRNVSDHLNDIESQISKLYGDNFKPTEWIISNKFNKADFMSLPSILNSPSKESVIIIKNRLELILNELTKQKLIDEK